MSKPCVIKCVLALLLQNNPLMQASMQRYRGTQLHSSSSQWARDHHAQLLVHTGRHAGGGARKRRATTLCRAQAAGGTCSRWVHAVHCQLASQPPSWLAQVMQLKHYPSNRSHVVSLLVVNVHGQHQKDVGVLSLHAAFVCKETSTVQACCCTCFTNSSDAQFMHL
jgi:hypothetical protein